MGFCFFSKWYVYYWGNEAKDVIFIYLMKIIAFRNFYDCRNFCQNFFGIYRGVTGAIKIYLQNFHMCPHFFGIGREADTKN